MFLYNYSKYALSISCILLLAACGGGGSSKDTTAPIFETSVNVTSPENTSGLIFVVATDNTAIKYSISGGEDKDLFVINATTGFLQFKEAPNYESPTDSDKNNIYFVDIDATDTSGNNSKLNLVIKITDIDETSNIDTDNDYIPDNIEVLLGMNINNNDVNNNNIDDGLESTGSNGDTFFDKQWYIRSLGTTTNDSGIASIVGNDLNLLNTYHHYMGYNKGKNIIVQVVDVGVDADHEDLIDNMDLTRSYSNGSVGDPSPILSNHYHGTKVAGIMAARAFNGIGVRGIAPFAKIAGSNWLEDQSMATLDKVWVSGVGANEIAVSNNSWGSYYDMDTGYEDMMRLGTSNLRDSKGRLYVFAGGNDADNAGNTNLQYCLNNRYAITATALNHSNKKASYASIGANIIVSGYGGEYKNSGPTIATTTVVGTSSNSGNINTKNTWSDDTKENYTYGMNGTSAASPTVAAALALVLEACPTLTWRDIKYLIATKSKKIDSSDSHWVQNSANIWHSIYYGFGLIDADAMISECQGGYSLLGVEKSTEQIVSNIDTVIPDDNTTKSFDISISDNIVIEWVEVTIDNNSSYASDYSITLVSPHNTKSTLMTIDTNDPNNNMPKNWLNGGFRLSSAGYAEEDSNGTWKLEIKDLLRPDSGTLKSIKLKIYGH